MTQPRFRQYWLPIVGVLLLAAWVRILGADHFPVWTDEGFTTWAISEPGRIIERLATDRHPPGYFLVLGWWQQVAGESHLALRLPSVLLGILTVAMIYRIGDDTFGRTAKPGREDVSWYGMLMFAVLPSAVYYSQEIRHFGPFVTSVCWSSLLFVRILRRPKWYLFVLYALSVALMMYIMYFGVWVVLVQVLVALVFWRGDYRINWRVGWPDKAKFLAAWAAAFVLYIPWIVVILRYQIGILGAGISAQDGTFSSSLPDLLRLLEVLMGGGLALTAGLYVVGFWGTLVSDRTDVTLGLRFANPAWLAEFYIMLWGLGLFVLLALLNIFTGALAARLTIFLSPALMAVVGAGIVRQRIGVRWSLLAGYLGVSLLLPPVITPRLDYPAAAEALAAQYRAGDLIVLETGWDDNAFRYEIRQEIGHDAEIIRTLPWVNNRDPYQPPVEQLADDLAAAERVWVVQWFQAPEVYNWLSDPANGYVQIEEIRTSVGEQYIGRFAAFGAAEDVRVGLFVRPADGPVAAFGEAFTLAGAAVAADVTPGDVLPVDLWWTTQQPVAIDYSVGVYLVDAGGEVVAQNDQGLGRVPTSAWEADGTLYYDGHALAVPGDLPPGEYRVQVAVYDFQQPDAPLPVDGDTRFTVGTVMVVG